ncbi:hypothetical protein [Anaerotruncus rubiinfantis]|uniref:hypothetical protein n=1 Tax=Anaerotruncus rubiinfantis TaxID=1720200 RepID=UPI00189BCFB3|nr:hypothetical protein [Anaerotruncus rubiinfantis]
MFTQETYEEQVHRYNQMLLQMQRRARPATKEPPAEAEPIVETEPIPEAEPILETEPIPEAEPIPETEPISETEPVTEAFRMGNAVQEAAVCEAVPKESVPEPPCVREEEKAPGTRWEQLAENLAADLRQASPEMQSCVIGYLFRADQTLGRQVWTKLVERRAL